MSNHLPSRIYGFIFLILGVCVSAGAASAQTTTIDQTRETVERVTTIREVETRVVERERTLQDITAAIFVKNRADEVLDAKVSVLEDLTVAALDQAGVAIISRENMLNAVASFADAGPNAGDPTVAGAQLDALLSNNTSATRLATAMGADYLLVASITTFSQNTRNVNAYGINSNIVTSTLRVTYNIVDATSGATQTSGRVTATKNTQAAIESATLENVIDDLLDDAAIKLADQLKAKVAAGRVAPPTQARPLAELTITCDVADFVVPEVYVNDNGDYVLGDSTYNVGAVDVTVELDGLTIGSAPGTFEVAPGIHRIRLTREGFSDWERTINVTDGQTLRVTMRMSDEGYARWQQQASFLEDLKADSKLTDATVEQIKSYAQMLRQSGYRIDVRKDMKVDTAEGVTVQNPVTGVMPYLRSIWYQAPDFKPTPTTEKPDTDQPVQPLPEGM